jgi:hypothetical protein
MASENLNNHFKTRNQPKINKILKLRFVFLGTFKVKTTLKLNSLHKMESFDSKIDHFGGRNQC